MEKMNVESFNLDHRAVKAPYVRIADRKVLPGGDTLIKYDIRFTQPNTAHLEMPTVHSIEHLSAEHMRNHTDRLIDFSPMGCQTGFYADPGPGARGVLPDSGGDPQRHPERDRGSGGERGAVRLGCQPHPRRCAGCGPRVPRGTR